MATFVNCNRVNVSLSAHGICRKEDYEKIKRFLSQQPTFGSGKPMQMEGYITLAVSYETPTTYDTTNYNIVFVKKGDMTKFWVDFRQLLECIDSKTAQQQNEQNKITITGMAGENGGGGP